MADQIDIKGDENEKLDDAVKVLLAEDDKDDQEIFQDAIIEAQIPADLSIVNDGQELLDNLRDPKQPTPDIIFVDLNMPLVNGKQALAEIKSDPELKEIPTIILSTSDSRNDIEDTFTMGASLYVQKPSSFGSFVALLKKIFMLKWAGVLLKSARKTFHLSEKDIPGEQFRK